MPFKRIILHLLFLCATTTLFAQQLVIDSLSREIGNCNTDTCKVRLLLSLTEYEAELYKTDTAIVTDSSAYKLSVKINYNKGIIQSLIEEGIIFTGKDLYTQAIDCELQAIALAKKNKEPHLAVTATLAIANLFLYQGDYASAMEFYNKTLDMPNDEDYDGTREEVELGMMRATLGQGNYYEVIVHANACLKINERAGNHDAYILAMTYMAFAYHSLRNNDLAKAYIQKAADSVKYCNRVNTLSEFYDYSTAIYIAIGDTTTAFKYALTWLGTDLQARHMKEYAYALCRVGNLYAANKDTARATYYFTTAQKLSSRIGYLRGVALAYYKLGDIATDSAHIISSYMQAISIQGKYRIKHDEMITYFNMGEYLAHYTINPILTRRYAVNAFDTLINAYNLAYQTGNTLYVELTAHLIGKTATVNGHTVVGMNYYYKALNIEQQYSYMSEAMTSSRDGIGYAYVLMGDSLRALQFLYKARKMEEDSGYKKDLVQTLTHYALVYELDRNFDKALLYFSKASALATEIHDTASLPLPDLCSGIIYEEQKWDTLKAYDYYYKAARESKNCHDIVHNSESLFRLAELLFHAHKYEEAEIFYDQCLNYAIASENDFIQMRCYHSLYVIYQAHNLAKESSDAYDKYRELVFKLKKEKQ